MAAAKKAKTLAEPSVEEKRTRRAAVITELNKADADQTKAVQAEARKAGKHEAKLDDAGAAEQQKVARDSNVELRTELGELTGPPVVAPVLEKSPGKIQLFSRLDDDLKSHNKGGFGREVSDARFVGNKLWLVGSGFPHPGEVIIDVRREDGQDHQRFSLWTDDDAWEANLPGLSGAGDWLIHAESLVTQVGEGRDDHLPLVLETKPIKLELH